jgi:hypothetical protein
MVTPRLPEHWSKFLLKQPETGMTYQIVDVTLRDGSIVRDVAITQSELVGEVRGYAEIPFDPADIVDMKVTHNKWEFSQRALGMMPRKPSNQPMKPTAPLRNNFSVFATTPCRGLSLSR